MDGQKEQNGQKEHVRLEFESHSKNEEFARVVVAVFMSRLDPTLEEIQDVKTAVSEAVTNAIIHGYGEAAGKIFLDLTADPADKTLIVSVTDTGMGIPDVKKAMEPLYTTDTTGERSGMTDQERGLEWALLLWKPLWMKLLLSQNREKERP